MPRKAKELPAAVVSRLSAPGTHRVGGVAGLLLQVSPTGGRSWILRAAIAGRRRDIGLGGYPDVTLARARERARELREQIMVGIDPVEARRAERARNLAVHSKRITFDDCAKAYVSAQQIAWKNAKHRAQWASTLATYASPIIGALPIEEVALPHIIQVLEPIWTTKPETAKRVQGRIERVLSWATVRGYRSGENPARWRGHLDQALPRTGTIRKVKHHAALPIDAVPEFFLRLREREGMGARAVEFVVLTAARSGEVRGARWNEIDLDNRIWSVPADRMKAKKAHIVPLSEPAVALLRDLPRIAGSDLVFPGAGGRPLSDMSLTAVLRRMEVDATVHGFRSSFKDWASERTHYPNEVSEMCLAHAIGSKVEAAYRRGDLLAKRKHLMADWASFLISIPEHLREGHVIPESRVQSGAAKMMSCA